ncbi:hypothetical protein SAMN05444007_108224 [Cribrihabitans marinus]|uniref:Uncharacterized protein n=1 Tax=Cribrihabitans marinus TaxID=1227549 RepID=A0A1H7CZ31_9RHOB|nr:hypothetical protein [Cribrihabitans marinus]GGH36130.1 hypothetical protein GCM10010973_29920 [Cribrihabitans marinus]SEJ91125.1 hypothetical protein SAMN05444007_108224 [Cribrihabitans marinus]
MAHPVEQTVPRAVPGPISDEKLEMAIRSAEALEGDWEDQKPEELGAHLNLISMVAAPLLRECLHHRRALRVIQDMAAPDNVTFLT